MYYSFADGGLGIDKSNAVVYVSLYGSAVYLSTILGGYISDKYIGSSNTLLLGGVFLIIGHLFLSLPFGVSSLAVGCLSIIFGTGMIRPSLSNQVGKLSTTPQQSNQFFTIFIMGSSFGGILATTIINNIGQNLGFRYGFLISASGMLIGVIIYVIYNLKNKRHALEIAKLSGVNAVAPLFIFIASCLGAFIYFVPLIYIKSIFTVVVVCVITGNFIFIYKSSNTKDYERDIFKRFIFVFCISVLIWTVSEQVSTVIAIFSDDFINRNIGNFELSGTTFEAILPVFSLLFSPIYLWLFVKFKKVSGETKMILGLAFMALSMVYLGIILYLFNGQTGLSPIIVIIYFFILIQGKLISQPVEMTLAKGYAPAYFVSSVYALTATARSFAGIINSWTAPLYIQSPIMYFTIDGVVLLCLSGILFLYYKYVI
jgi:POT family proton-dependent oligopeptide transporter